MVVITPSDQGQTRLRRNASVRRLRHTSWCLPESVLQSMAPYATMITSSSLTANLTPAEKFLKFTGLTIPDPPSARPIEATTNPEVALTYVDADTKYCGPTAKSEFAQLFRTMVSRQHLGVEPRSHARELPEVDLAAYKAVIPDDDDEPDFDTMLCEPFTARHEFASLCLERELPPSAGLLLRKTQTPAIDISHYGMGDDLARVWAASIVDVPNVTSLNLRNNRLTDAGLPSIIAALTAKPRIAILDLSENKLDSECVDALATYLQSPVCALQELRMSHADVDDAEIGPVVHALYLNQSVHLLDLSHNLLGSHERRRKTPRGTTLVGGDAIGAMLEANTTLRSLDLSWNTLRLSGAVAIGRGLGRNNSLLELNLSYNAIGETGAAAVGVALGSNAASKLERVDISDNNVSAQAALVLSQTILVNARLRFLILDGNPLGSQGGRSLFHAVAQCPNKQLRISMQRCNFDLNVHNASKFNPDDVSGQYELDLAVPYERSIAIELVRCATRKNGCRFRSILYVPPPSKTSRRASVKPMSVQVLLTTTPPPGMIAEPQSREALEALFHQLDYDTSGTIDETELARGMRRLGLDARESDVRKLLARYDLDGSGTIEVDEFVDMMSWLYRQAALKLQAQSVRQLIDVRTNEPLEVPTLGRWIVDFVDLRLPADAVEAETLTVGGLDHLLRNIRENANKVQLLHVAKQGMVLSSAQAQTILDNIMEGLDTVHAMASLLPYMIDCRNACVFIDTNLSEAARGRLQHLLLQAYGPIVGMASDHYKLDLADALDRSTAKKLLEMNNKCALEWPTIHPLKPTDERCFRNAYHSGSAVTLDAKMLTWRFGVLEFDFVHRVRPPKGTLPLSSTRFAQVLAKLQMDPTKETPKWRKVGKDGVIKRSPKVYDRLRELRQMKHVPPAVDRAAITCNGENGTEVVLTARRLLMELQAALCTRYVSVQQVRGILLQWPPEFASSRVDALVFMFDRLVDLHHFYQVEAILTDAEVAQCLHRLGWLNTWTPLIPEMYYELDMAIYEEREITKYLIALALAEPGENWIGETFGWTLDTTIPGWKLNAQWTSDETMPRKGILRLEYYSGADQGCSPIWHVRQNLCRHMLAHPLTPDELDAFRTTVTM